MAFFDTLQRASFEGFEFPISEVRIKGSYRKFEHIYLRVPGAVLEKLERGLYMVEMKAHFDVNIKGYPDLYPAGLSVLRQKYEMGVTAPLVIPTIGTMRAMMPEWDQLAMMAKVRSGETATLHFLEDNTERFLETAAEIAKAGNVQTAVRKWESLLDAAEPTPPERDIFDQIQDRANQLLAFRDQAMAFQGQVLAKIEALTSLIREADATLAILKNPINADLINALHDLWEAVIDLGANIAGSSRSPRVYICPNQMTINQVSSAIYGNTSRSMELLQNNVIDDAFAISAGSTIIYFTV